MFWGDWGSDAKIEKANMDGSNRAKILDSTVLRWPNGLAIDYDTSRLYWTDAKMDHIMSSNFDGGQRDHVATGLSHPFGLDVYNGYVYWGDWVERRLLRTRKKFMTSVLLRDVKGLMEVRVYKKELISDNTDACHTAKEPCDQLCLLKSSRQRTCACQDGFKLTDDGRKCVGKNYRVCDKLRHSFLL